MLSTEDTRIVHIGDTVWLTKCIDGRIRSGKVTGELINVEKERWIFGPVEDRRTLSEHRWFWVRTDTGESFFRDDSLDVM